MKSSRLCIAFGFLISLAGIVGLVWTQLDVPFGGLDSHEATFRWQYAMAPLTVIALGVLISIGGLIVSELQARRLGNDPASISH